MLVLPKTIKPEFTVVVNTSHSWERISYLGLEVFFLAIEDEIVGELCVCAVRDGSMFGLGLEAVDHSAEDSRYLKRTERSAVRNENHHRVESCFFKFPTQSRTLHSS